MHSRLIRCLVLPSNRRLVVRRAEADGEVVFEGWLGGRPVTRSRTHEGAVCNLLRRAMIEFM